MLRDFFNLENPVWKFFGRLSDLMILNFLWLLCCLPVFTIGASTTALYYCTLKIVRDEDDGDVRMFFRSFKLNFVEGTKIFLIMAVTGAVLGFDIYYMKNVYSGAEKLRFFLSSAFGAMAILWIFTFLYVWPVLSRFDNTVRITIQNALLMSVRHLGSTLIVVVTDVLLAMLTVVSFLHAAALTPIIILLGIPGAAYLNSFVFEHIFEKYMPKKEEQDEEMKPILTELNPDGTLRDTASEEFRRSFEALKSDAAGTQHTSGENEGDEKGENG